MKNLIKYAGVIIILIAVLILIIPALMGTVFTTNTLLIVSLVLLVIGLLVHIFVNKNPN